MDVAIMGDAHGATIVAVAAAAAQRHAHSAPGADRRGYRLSTIAAATAHGLGKDAV
jgi:hypothetical protein